MRKKFYVALMIILCAGLFLFSACDNESPVTSIVVEGIKTQFAWGEEFSIGEDTKVVATREDETTFNLSASDFTVDSSAYKKDKAGEYVIKVTYNKNEKIVYSYKVTVSSRAVTSICLNQEKLPKAEYFENEEFDATGSILATYNDGTTETISLDNKNVKIIGFNTQAVANNKSEDVRIITVQYGNKTTTFNIVVKKIIPISATIKTMPTKLVYYTSSNNIEKTSGEIEVVFNNGNKTVVSFADSKIGFNLTNLFDVAGENKSVGVTYTYRGATVNTAFNIEVKEVIPTSITIYEAPKNVYFKSATVKTIDRTIGSVFVTYNDGHSNYFDLSSLDLALLVDGNAISDANFNNSGEKTVSVSYTMNEVTVSTSYTINVYSKDISSIAVQSNPTKTTYFVGETVDLTGLVLKLTYNDSSTSILNYANNLGISFVANTATNTGVNQREVVVSYFGYNCSFNIVVKDILSISMNVNPTKTDYVLGETIDVTGGTIQITYTDYSREVVDITSAMVSNQPLSVTGEQQVTVTVAKYETGSVTTTFNINVYSIKIESLNSVNFANDMATANGFSGTIYVYANTTISSAMSSRTIVVQNGATLTIGVNLSGNITISSNAGLVIDTGVSFASVNLVNNGTVTINGTIVVNSSSEFKNNGTVVCSGSIINHGTISNDANAMMTIGGTLNNAGASIENAGTIAITGTVSTINLGTIQNSGTITHSQSHIYANWTNNYTAIEGHNPTNQHMGICVLCGETAYEAHSFGDWQAFNETQHRRQCSCCNEWQYANHSDNVIYSEINGNDTNHIKVCTCSVCGSERQTNEAHNYGVWSCDDETNHVGTCGDCGHVCYEEHTFGEWQTTVPATVASVGARIRTCTCAGCGRQESDTIARLNGLLFNANGGECSTAEIASNGNEMLTLPTATKTNETFIGWFTQDGTGDAWGTQVEGDTYEETAIVGQITLYAKFEADSITQLSYDIEGMQDLVNNPNSDILDSETALAAGAYLLIYDSEDELDGEYILVKIEIDGGTQEQYTYEDYGCYNQSVNIYYIVLQYGDIYVSCMVLEDNCIVRVYNDGEPLTECQVVQSAQE